MNKPMSFIAFLKDRWLLLIGWVIFFLLMILVMWLTPDFPIDWGTVGYLFLMESVVLLLFLGVFYITKRRFWQKLTFHESDSVLQNYIHGARSSEEELVQNYINQLIREHQDLMQQVISNQEEQKEYIDSWVHEIKVPLAATRLLLNSIEFDIPDEKVYFTGKRSESDQ